MTVLRLLTTGPDQKLLMLRHFGRSSFQASSSELRFIRRPTDNLCASTHIRVKYTPHPPACQSLSHSDLRCLSTSYETTDADMAAFRDSTLPHIGILTSVSAAFDASSDSPLPSFPIRKQRGPRRSLS